MTRDLSFLKIGLYVHIPFCLSKCFYCAFNSKSQIEYLIPDYIRALKKHLELILFKYQLQQCKIDTIYFGGGTPSILKPQGIEDIFSFIKSNLDLSQTTEISIEINPNTISDEKLKVYKDIGINRISLGAQSFDDDTLKFLGRTHTSQDIFDAYYKIRKFDFKNVNLDIISAVPFKRNSWTRTIDYATKLDPEHISMYQLSIERGSEFAKNIVKEKINPLSEDEQVEDFIATKRTLEDKGYKHYEVSNYSKPGFECAHNIIYWTMNEYIAIGAGAHSFLSNKRFAAFSDPSIYVENIFKKNTFNEFEEKLNADKISWDYVLFGLRLTQGVSVVELEKKCGLEFMNRFLDKISVFIDGGFIVLENGNVKLTLKGILVCDEIAVDIIE